MKRYTGLDLCQELESYSGAAGGGIVTLTSADSGRAHRVVPAHPCKIPRQRSGALLTRPPSAITHVVIHSLAGHYENAIRRWQRGEACFKPHYVISRGGEITQIVAERYIPQHANAANGYSVGIEHDGFTRDPVYFTEAMYLASAALTRDICQRYAIPMDRTRVIGHDEAPGTGHGDPGGYWDWEYYLALVNWDGNPATRPVRQVVDYTSYSFWPTSQAWQEIGREQRGIHRPVRHSPYPEHSYGPKYYRAPTAPEANDPAVFIAEITLPGNYELSAWWPVLAGNSPQVTIRAATGDPGRASLAVVVNQSTRAGRVRRTLALPNTPVWYPLGSLPLRAGDVLTVEVSRKRGAPGWAVADAIRLLKRT